MVTRTMRSNYVMCAVLMAIMASGAVTSAQAPQPSGAAAKPAEKILTPLKVQVTISRFEGAKATSTLPFTMWVNANGDTTSLNVGLRVPAVSGTSSYYNLVGTSLTCSAVSADDGRFRVTLEINDSSLAPSKELSIAGNVSLQSFSSKNYLLLHDGQNAQFASATDKVTGEVTKVDVTVTVLK